MKEVTMMQPKMTGQFNFESEGTDQQAIGNDADQQVGQQGQHQETAGSDEIAEQIQQQKNAGPQCRRTGRTARKTTSC